MLAMEQGLTLELSLTLLLPLNQCLIPAQPTTTLTLWAHRYILKLSTRL